MVITSFAGCGTKNTPQGKRNSSQTAPTAVAEAVLLRWEQGDASGAVLQFLNTDWSLKPLFAPESAMNLSEAQFKALSAVERESKSAEVQTRLSALRKLAGAVAQAGRDAAARQDMTLAQNHFTSLDQLGSVLDAPDFMLIVQLSGKGLKKMAAAEAAKLSR